MAEPLSASAVRLPAEWEPQSGVLLTWPEDRGDWAGLLPRVEPGLAAMAAEISHRERLIVACADIERVCARLSDANVTMDRANVYPVPSNDIWARDHAPITVIERGQPCLLDFAFNGWGLKYPAVDDNLVSRRLANAGAFSAPMYTVGLVLEGGSIESDGAGTLLTTAQCLLSPNRNPHLGRAEIESELRKHLGVKRVLWLEHGHLDGDDTDAHIDTLVRFCSPTTLAYAAPGDARGDQADSLRAMEKELRALRTAEGAPYELVPLPMPKPLHNDAGEPLPATYANFLILNGAVLVPTYSDPRDEEALTTLKSLFPGREAIPIDATGLVLQYGALHCASMQFPEGVLR